MTFRISRSLAVCASAFATFLTSSAAQADIVTIEFEGHVDSADGSYLPLEFSVGNSVHGVFSYDTDATGNSNSTTGYYQQSFDQDFEVAIDGVEFSRGLFYQASTRDNFSYDSVEVVTFNPSAPNLTLPDGFRFSSLTVALRDSTQTALSSTELPTEIEFSDWPFAQVRLQVANASNQIDGHLLATITSLTQNDGDICPGGDDNVDSDGDSIPDACDLCPLDDANDADGDGICGDVDICPADANNDADADGICGDVDVCPADPDNDSDGDGICGDVDICPHDPANDSDGDGVCGDVDVCAGGDDNLDEDGDGMSDHCDACPSDADNDIDGDGVCGDVDPCPSDNPDDSDGDGACDSDDECPNDPAKIEPGDCGCGTPDSYPAWAAGSSYAVDQSVSYAGVNYQSRQAHTAWNDRWSPPLTPALWNVVASCSTDAWTVGVAYATDAVVSYEGSLYRCRQSHTAHSAWAPTAVPALWETL